MKYKAKFYIEDTKGYKWAESTTPLWDSYEKAEDNAKQYADYVNSRTLRKVNGFSIVEIEGK